jgi:hypothetical protein
VIGFFVVLLFWGWLIAGFGGLCVAAASVVILRRADVDAAIRAPHPSRSNDHSRHTISLAWPNVLRQGHHSINPAFSSLARREVLKG